MQNNFDTWESFFYEGTDVLVNIPGIRNKEELAKYEAEHSLVNIAKIYSDGTTFSCDTDGYKKIHKAIFGDIYPWAGEFRKVDIGKGITEFCPHKEIEQCLSDKLFEIECSPEFYHRADNMAYYYAEICCIHPFREGNGRTQRVFFRSLLREHGLMCDFGAWSKAANNIACEEAYRLNYKPLQELFQKSLQKFDGKNFEALYSEPQMTR